MVERYLLPRGIEDEGVLEAMGRIPRHLFVDEALAAKAYGDYSLPIGFKQTISQPYMVARMSELLDVGPQDRVLEVGTGCGYHTAVLARLAYHVYSIERLPGLAERARENLRRVRVLNVSLSIADGSLGWQERGPYDRIVVAAGARRVPEALVAQLGENGRMVIPIGEASAQRLTLVRRTASGVVEDDQGACTFVKLVGEYLSQ